MDVELDANQVWKIDTNPKDTVFIYILEGQAKFEKTIHNKTAVTFSDGKTFQVESGKDKLRFLYLSAPKLEEPIAWGGPIVMNTKEELRTAFAELKENTFLKHKI